MTNKEAAEIIVNYDTYGCGYCHQGGDEIPEAFNMAIEALKAQEPRVMTADDLLQLKYGSIAILEQKITGVIISAVVVDNITLDGTLEVLQVVTPSVNGVANADYDYYGKTWRCWTSRPTDEQRNNTPWEV